MEKKIVKPNGSEYMTVVSVGDTIEFRNFSEHNVTIKFDARVLDQVIPFLTEINFWNKVKEKSNGTSN